VAQHSVTDSIKLYSDNDLAYYNRGIAHASLRQYDRAMQDLDTALKLDPGLAKAYNGRGSVYRHLGEYKRAFQDFERAVKLDPEHSTRTYNNRGNA